MENREKYLIIGIVVLVAVVAVAGGVYAYGYYMNQKFEENFKLQYQAANNSNKYYSDVFSDNKTYNNKEDWDASNTRAMVSLNKSIEYCNKAISYEQEMIKYAPDETHKRYAETLMKMNQEALKVHRLYLEYFQLFTWPGTVTDKEKEKQILSDINTTQKNIETLSNEKNQIKLLDPNLNNQIERLTNESAKAIT